MKISTVSGAFLLLKNPIVSENIISEHKKSSISYHEKQKNMKKFQKAY